MENVPPVSTAPALRRLDPLTAISGGFSTFGQRPGQSIGIALLMVMLGAAQKIPMLGWIFALVVQPTLYGGFYRFGLQQQHGGKPPFEVVVSGFNRLWAYTALQLLLWLLTAVAMTPTIVALVMAGLWTLVTKMASDYGPEWRQFVAVIPICAANLVLLGWLWARIGFSIVCLADDPACGPIQSLQRSWRMTRGTTLRVLAFMIVCVIVGLAGILALIVGLLVALPVIMFALTSAYDQIRENAKA